MYSVNETVSVALEALNRVMNTPSSVRDTSYAVAKAQNARHENAASINIVNMDMIEFLLCSILIFVIVLLVVGLLSMSGKRISLPKFSVSFSLTRCTNILRNCFRKQDQGLCIYFYDNSDRWVECKIETRTNELLQSASAFKVEYRYFYPVFRIKIDCFGPYLRMCWGSTRVVVKETQEKIRIKKARIPLRQVFELRNILNSNVYTYFFAVRDSDGKFEKVSGGTANYYKFRSRRTLEDGTLEPEQAVIWRSTGSVTETCEKESVLEIDTSHAHNETCAVDVSDNSQTDMLHAHNEADTLDGSDNSQIDMSHTQTVNDTDDSDSCSESDDFLATSEENLSTSGSVYSMSSSESTAQFYLPIRTADGRTFFPDWVYRERAEARRQTEIELEKTSDFVDDVSVESDDSN